MKGSGVVALVVLASIAFGLQGCATTGTNSVGATGGSSWEATGPNTAVSQTPSANQPVVKADTKANFEAVVAAIHKQMQPGGRWQYINKSERATIDGSFADMGKLFDQYGSVARMDQAAKARMLADQTTVNTLLTKKDGDRIICQSEVVVGSHFPTKVCKTYAQIQAEQRNSQETLRQLRANSLQRLNDTSDGHH